MHCHEHRDYETNVTVGLLASLCINTIIASSEIIAGVISGSVALIADAAHNFGDVLALALAVLARRLGSRPPSLKLTYGLERIEVIAGVLNAAVLAVIAVLIIKHALFRLFHPEPFQTGITLVVASVAVVANGISALLLRHHDPQDVNVRIAFLHMCQDVLSSLLVVVSAAMATKTQFGNRLDAIAAIIIGVAVVVGALSVLGQALATLLEGVPDGIHIQSLVESVERQFSAVAMHHVHVWQVGPRKRVLTAHLLVQNMDVAEAECLCNHIRRYIKEEWHIQHATLEPEVKGCGSDTVLGSWSPVFGDQN